MKELVDAELEQLLLRTHGNCSGIAGGAPASYIPELFTVDPELFAIAACRPGGTAAGVGDDSVAFTLQSLSKPFVYGWALERCGAEAVHARVGVEPTGQAFDSLVRLERDSHRPHNPMVNAGAIAITGLLIESGADLGQLLAFLGACAGESLDVDVPVWLSERSAGHTNRASAHLMRHFGVLAAEVEPTLELYFRQCAMLVTCKQLATMATTLASGGICPASGERVLAASTVAQVLTVMSTCGMYDASGRFVFDVGLPAKSGVSGGLVVVAPGCLGLAAYSPAIDADGTSLRAHAALAMACEELHLHRFEPSGSSSVNAPPRDVLRESLTRAESAAIDTGAGRVADDSPRMAAASRERLGLAICTVDGLEFERGDARVEFTMQASCNPFAYAHVHAAIGRDEIHRHVGVEPSGNSFHAIAFDPRTGRPYNPMGNAGAITVAGLAPGDSEAERLRRLLDFLSACSGGKLRVDAAEFEAELRTSHRNRAIAALLSGAELVQNEEAALLLYLQQCCVTVDAVHLARMAAMLARGGVPHGASEALVSPQAVRDTLSLMYTSGLHDGSGSFAFEVGLPAKSGISGALVAVVPNLMGLVAWSPAIDERGTSVRGAAALRAFSQQLDLAVFSPHSITLEPS